MTAELHDPHGTGPGNLPAREWLIEGVIPRHGTVMVVGPPKSLKTYFALGLAMSCTVRTKTALGTFIIKKPLRVAWLDCDNNLQTIAVRLNQLKAAVHLRDSVVENLLIADFGPLSEPGLLEIRRMADHFKPDLIILDSVRGAFKGTGDLNSVQDAYGFLEKIDAIRSVTNAAIMLIHHTNKKTKEPEEDQPLGSLHFAQWAQVMILLSQKKTHDHSTTVEVQMEGKFDESLTRFRLTLDLQSPEPIRLEPLVGTAGAAWQGEDV